MSARDVAIDTLTFADLVRLGLEDLPRASQGAWTQHGAVDPGVTILELLAWQLEQRLFMADQLSEPIVRAGLRLLGLPDPEPARAAATVLSVSGSAGPLPAGTVFGLAGDARGRAFALDGEVHVLPVSAVRVAGRMLLAGDELVFELDTTATTTHAGSELSLLVEVVAAPGVGPSWHRNAVEAEPPARLDWIATGPDGVQQRVEVRDRTGALRRSGLLSVPWPAVWDRPGPAARRLRAVALAASYTEPVRVVAVHANAAVASHRVDRHADVSALLDGMLPLPGQVLPVPGSAGALCDVVLSMTERGGERHDWHGVASLAGSGPADRVVLVDRARGELRFGDGRSGRIPRPAATPAAGVRYALGAGRDGNLGARRRWAQDGGAAVAVNPVAADGGADAETLAAARQRAADALATIDRTVTVADTRELARRAPGIGLRRAHVSPGVHPAFPCDLVPGALAVTIVPHADRTSDPGDWTAAPQPDAGALATARACLERARLLGQEIAVLSPVYRRVDVDVSVSASGDPEDTRELVDGALRRYLDALTGGPDGDGWPFGDAVRPSALAGVVQDELGPEATVTSLAAGLDGGPRSACADLKIGDRELVVLGEARIALAAFSPTGAGLR